MCERERERERECVCVILIVDRQMTAYKEDMLSCCPFGMLNDSHSSLTLQFMSVLPLTSLVLPPAGAVGIEQEGPVFLASARRRRGRR